MLMVGSMLFFAFEDLFQKKVAMIMPPGQVIAMMGFMGAAIFWGIAARLGQPILDRRALKPIVVMRSISEGISGALFVVAMTLIPLTLASALLQATPLMVTMGAALFLREPVGWRRWSAICVGMIGVLIILRPGFDGFQPAGLLIVGCVMLMTARDLATRVMPKAIGTFQVMTWAYMALVPAGILLMLYQGTPLQVLTLEMWALLLGATIFGLFGYYLVTSAMRLGEVSVVAPLRYTRLVFAMIIAYFALNEVPDWVTILGSALVILSGLYTFWREAVRKRPIAAQSIIEEASPPGP